MSASQRRWSPAFGFGLVVAVGLAMTGAPGALAQAPTKTDTKKDEKKKVEPDAAELARATAPTTEVLRDPRVRTLLDNSFEPLFRRGESIVQQQVDQVRAMAEKGAINKQLLQNYVRHMAKELTDRANIEAMLDMQKGNPTTFLRLEEAANRLAVPLEVANLRGNLAFRKALVQEMLAKGVGDELLKNHLYARVQFMIALANSAEPEALEFFNGVLVAPNQPALVKHWAARGITKVVGGGKRADALDANARIKSARALSEFLRNEPDTIWPALDRALEALGALRVDSFDPGKGDLEFLAIAATYLARAKAPELRARAAWAVGMLRINPNGRVNYPLLALHAGAAAVDLGERAIGEYSVTIEPSDMNSPSRYWTTRLIAHVGLGLKGDPDLGESGLLTQATRAVRGEELRVVSGLEERVRESCKAADALGRAVGALRSTEKSNFAKTIGEVRAFLTANPPKSTTLFPGGPDLPLAAPGVAER